MSQLRLFFQEVVGPATGDSDVALLDPFEGDAPEKSGTGAEDESGPEFSPPQEDDEPTLRLGDESVDGWVEYLQELLNLWVEPGNLPKSGKFDRATYKAVLAFQKQQKLKKKDGVVGNETWAALRLAPPEQPGTDGRKKHTFVEQGAKARWFVEDGPAVYFGSADELRLLLVSVGDTSIAGKKAHVFVTAPGAKRKGKTVAIPATSDKSPSGEGDLHIIVLGSFKKEFPPIPADQPPLQGYLVEAYFDQELGGDRWSGEVVIDSDPGSAGAAAPEVTAPEVTAPDGDKPQKSAAAVLESINIEPENAGLAVGGQQQFRATGVYDDGTTRDLTATVDWWCNDLDVIAVDEQGVATAQPKGGAAEIVATDAGSGITGSTNVTVTAAAPQPSSQPSPSAEAALVAIRIGPESVALDHDKTQQFTAIGVYADGSERDLSATAVWLSSDPKMLSIDPRGLATAQRGKGTALLTATDKDSNITASIQVTVKKHGIVRKEFSRGLTAAERSEAQSVFQDSLDYDKVVIVSGGLGSAGAAARTIGNKVCMAAEYFEENSTKLTPQGLEVLMHELGHVWQFQHGGLAYIPNALAAQAAGNAYDDAWRLAHADNKPWDKWNAEQQAEAMEDYYVAKERIEAAQNEHPPATPNPTDEETVAILTPYVGKVVAGDGAPGRRRKR